MKRLLLPLTLALLLILATSCTQGKKDPTVTTPADGTAAATAPAAADVTGSEATEEKTVPADTSAAGETEPTGTSPEASPETAPDETDADTMAATSEAERETQAPGEETTSGGIVLPRDEF